MPRRLFIDSSAFIALEEADDQYHLAAQEFTQTIEMGTFDELVSSSYIFDELMSWFSRYPDKKIELGESLRTGPVRLEWINKDVEDEAWKTFLSSRLHPFSLTDCTSFVLMDRLRIRDVFTFNQDFARLGKYTVLPVDVASAQREPRSERRSFQLSYRPRRTMH